MRIRSWQIGVGLASMLLGMLLVFQLRTETSIRTDLPFTSIERLSSYIKKLETDKVKQDNERKKAEEEISNLRRQLREYDRDEEVTALRMGSGIYPLKGEGVEVLLADANRKLRAYEDPNLFVVHYDQLELLVNELWAAGAEAISVNEERIVTQTGFSCAGATIIVGDKKVAPPYRIKAIGDKATLKAALNMPGGFIESQILPFELEVTIIEKDEIYIPPFKGSMVFRYARVVAEEKEGEGVAEDNNDEGESVAEEDDDESEFFPREG